MNWFIVWDARVILTVFEPTAWHVEYRSAGKLNCFSLSRGTFTLAILAFIMGIVLGDYPEMIMLSPVAGVFWLGFMAVSVSAEHAVVTRPNQLNPIKMVWYMRAGYLFSAAALPFLILPCGFFDFVGDFLAVIFVVASLYFTACNPMPPQWEPPMRESKLAAAPALS